MKYATKEWYIAMQNTALHLLLQPTEKAAVYSETFFQELYEQRVQERLELMERVSKIDCEELASRFENAPSAVHLDGTPITPEEDKIAQNMSAFLAKDMRSTPSIVFDPEKERRVVQEQYLFNLHKLQLRLPESIKAKVADLRVLALNYATAEVIQEITTFCNTNNEFIESASAAYRAEFQRNFGNAAPAFYWSLNFHDDTVTALLKKGQDIYMHFDEHDVPCCFQDAEVILCDGTLEGAIWLYEEIFPLDDGRFEIHILLLAFSDLLTPITADSLIYLTIRCRDVKIG